MTKSKTTIPSSAQSNVLPVTPKKTPSNPSAKPSPKVFQFKIKLRGITPMIWRRVQLLSSSTFGDLHAALQDSMGWDGYHLHEFSIYDSTRGYDVPIGSAREISEVDYTLTDQDKVKLDRYFSLDNKKAEYTYDFGDDWAHDIVLEKILEPEEGQIYPRCITGKRACPPEDCGGIWGYQDLLDILADPRHEEHNEKLEWCGGKFDPEEFDPLTVRFTP